jgi:hypothetical protein
MSTTVNSTITDFPIFGSGSTEVYVSGSFTATYIGSTLESISGTFFATSLTGEAALFQDPLIIMSGPSSYSIDFNSTTNFGPNSDLSKLVLSWNGEYPTTLSGKSINNNGTLETVTNTGSINSQMACYCLGTMLLTPDGEVAVEDLTADQLLVTASGEAKPIRWIGQSRIDMRRHADPDMIRPIRIAAGALADNLPARDLLVSPDHAILVDGALVPARLLVNHRSVTEEADMMDVNYFHVELDQHDIIFAEGAAAETYLDTGNRNIFENNPVTSLHVDMSVGERLRMPQDGACMPLVTDPEAVFPIWQRIADRAGVEVYEGGEPAVGDAGIRLVAGTRTLRPVVTEGDRMIFALPRDTTEVRLVSAAARPSKARPWLDDRRDLGVAVKAISADETAIALDGPSLGAGWWDVEMTGTSSFRWTNGSASVAVPAGTKLLTVRIHAMMAAAEQTVQAKAA